MSQDATYRDLFLSIMHYGEFDHMPVVHWACWPETRERWLKEGLPEEISEHDYFKAWPTCASLPINVGLYPAFEEQVIEETDEYRILRQNDGVVVKDWKTRSCIPHYIDFTMKDRSGWDQYRARLQPDPHRISPDLDAKIQDAKDRGFPVAVSTGSMIGWARNWLGVENLAYACYDDRDLIAEIADTVADLVCWAIDQVAPKVHIDMGWGWEDICFRNGPLISPHVFRECCVPAYRKVADRLALHGCDLYVVDCDGKIDDLVPLWLEGGVNVMFPIEIGAWQADPMEFRRQFGKELRVFGGIDKKEIAKGPAAIDAEIRRRLPLMRDGGFIPLPDHLLIPSTSLDDYKYYLERMRELRF